MNLGGIDKVLSTLEKNGSLIGGAYGLFQDPLSSPDPIGYMIDRITHWKIPDLNYIITYLLHDPHYSAFPLGIELAIGGWLLKEIGGDIEPHLGRVGGFLQKAGVGAAIGSGIGALLWLPAQNPHGFVSGGSPGGSRGYGY